MRSTHVAPIPNMKGKPFYVFRCGCCEAQDFRAKERAKQDRRLMTAAKRGRLDEEFLHQVEMQ